MRLAEMLRIVVANLKRLTLAQSTEALPNGQPGVRINNLNDLREAVSSLREIVGLSAPAGAVLDHEAMKAGVGSVQLPQASFVDFHARVERLKDAVTMMRNLLGPVVPVDEGRQVEIRLPEIDDLAHMAVVLSMLARLFDQTSKSLTGEPVGFSGGDRGSPDWITVSVGGEHALAWVHALVMVLLVYFGVRRKDRQTTAELRITINHQATPHLAESIGHIETSLREKAQAEAREALEAAAADIQADHEARAKAVNLALREFESASELAGRGLYFQLSPKTLAAVETLGGKPHEPLQALPPIPERKGLPPKGDDE